MGIDATGDVGVNPSISAYTKYIFISNYDVTNTSLKVAKSTDGGKTWSAPTVNNAADVGRYSDVYTADGTNVSIVYSDTTNGDLKLARSNNGGSSSWTISTIESTGIVGAYLAGVAGAPGTAYVSYADATNKCLKVAKTTDSGTTWTLSRVTASAGDNPQWTSIGLSLSDSVPCVSYYSGTTLWFAKSLDGGATW